jgi:hypothetical protein
MSNYEYRDRFAVCIVAMVLLFNALDAAGEPDRQWDDPLRFFNRGGAREESADGNGRRPRPLGFAAQALLPNPMFAAEYTNDGSPLSGSRDDDSPSCGGEFHAGNEVSEPTCRSGG